MFQKLKSRKLLVSLAASIFAVVAPALGVPAATIALVAKIAALYIGVEGAVDIAGAHRGE